MLTVSVLVPFSGTEVGTNDLVTVGGATTVKVAVLLVVPVPPLVELTVPVVFDTVPAWVPVTFTTIVQVLPGVAMLPPDRLIVVVFAVAVTVPPQVLLTPGVLATCSPPVNVSEKAIPFSAVVFAAGLVIVKVTVVVPFSGILAAPNALLIVGGATTVRLTVLLAAPVPPLVELTAPVVFDTFPACVPLTFTVTVQVFPGVAMLPPDRLIVVVLAVAVTAPPQVLLTPGVPATCRPPVSVSEKAIPFSAVVFAAGLVMVKVTVVAHSAGF